MTTTMDAAGRVVLPKRARERARLQPGVPLEVRVIDGRIEIEAAPAHVTLQNHRGFWVATPTQPTPSLTQEQVDLTLETIRTHGLASDEPE